MSTSTASQAWLFHGLHTLHILIYLDCFMVPAVSQSQHFARILILTAEGISAFTVALVSFIIIQRSCWGVCWFQSVCLSVRLSVRLSWLPCPLCNIYSSGWILSILATNDHYHERVCRTQWPLTLTYIFKVIRPWLRKSCPLCSVYSSG